LVNTGFIAFLGDPYPLLVVQIFAGLIGFGLFSLMLLERGNMPPAVPVVVGKQNNLRAFLRLIAVAVIAATISGFIGFSDSKIVEGLREITLLGGIGPGVILFLPVFFLQLYIISLIERRLDGIGNFRPAVSIIIPAYNESQIIAET